MKISKILVYDEPSVPEINLDSLIQFLEKTFKIKTEKRKNIFSEATAEIAKDLASIRIFDFRKPFEAHIPTNEEIEFEMESFVNTAKTQNIILYDGFEFQRVISSLIPKDELGSEYFHIVFTNKLTCTFDLADYRYHGRALIGSNPSVISTTGIIEAPAKPRQYYLDLMTNYGQGLNIESIKKKYQGKYLEYHDTRLGTVVEGYCLQALFYYLSGEPFCEMLDCRLHNAHWQHELLYSQIESRRLCDKHEKILEEWLT
ncbi:MAG: DUF6775 family putative metallopeptidase [Thermoproteota archaeon]